MARCDPGHFATYRRYWQFANNVLIRPIWRPFLCHRHGGQPVSIVGWSMGGIFGRRLARANPAAVRQVITLGSPFRMMSGVRSADLAMPSTAVYSKTDGVAPWSTCCDGAGARHESIEVVGSHCGLGHHPAVLHVVADRLAQPPGTWMPFEARGLWRPWFPSIH